MSMYKPVDRRESMKKDEMIKMLVWAFNEGYDTAFKIMDSIRENKLNEKQIIKQFNEELIKKGLV